MYIYIHTHTLVTIKDSLLQLLNIYSVVTATPVRVGAGANVEPV